MSQILACVLVGLSLWGMGCDSSQTYSTTIVPSIEDREADGRPYNPATQSFLRGHHALEEATVAGITLGSDGDLSIALSQGAGPPLLTVVGMQLDELVPKLHYKPSATPDAFDAFNLMMAEYSRNGLSVPVGQSSDAMAHFETELAGETPWHLKGDYDFVPQADLRPLRVGATNNCLSPGLWEMAAIDRAGEIYHGWFDFPLEPYYSAIAAANGVAREFAVDAVAWRTEPVPLHLERLRVVESNLGEADLSLSSDHRAGFSSQDSRRKLSQRFALVEVEGELRRPQSWLELLKSPVHLSEFVPPGKYALNGRKVFDLSFLANPEGAVVREVRPLTDYTPLDGEAPAPREEGYIELTLALGGFDLVIGNLAVDLLVPQEEMVIHGFGVGVLAASGFAERRAFLLADGPAPPFMYLVDSSEGQPMAVNSHDLGVEQLFIRTHLEGETPWWEITLTSYERIVDLVRYRVDVPPELHSRLREAAKTYRSPLYYTYRDDNLR